MEKILNCEELNINFAFNLAKKVLIEKNAGFFLSMLYRWSIPTLTWSFVASHDALSYDFSRVTLKCSLNPECFSTIYQSLER